MLVLVLVVAVLVLILRVSIEDGAAMDIMWQPSLVILVSARCLYVSTFRRWCSGYVLSSMNGPNRNARWLYR